MAGTSITRSTFVKGPGTLRIGGLSIFSASGIEVPLATTTVEIPSDLSGVIDRQITDRTLTISLTPTGAVSAALLAALYKFGQPVLGGSIFGDTDVPLELHTRAGKKITFASAALAKVPTLYLRSAGAIFGPAEFQAVLAKGKAPGEEGSLIDVADLVYALGNPTAPNLAGKVYAGIFGSGETARTFDSTEDGFTFAVNVSIKAEVVDALGTLDYTITSVSPELRFKPKDVGEVEAIELLNLNAARGSSIATGKDFVVSAAGGIVLTLKNVAITTAPLSFATDANRAGEIVVVPNPDATGLLYTVAYPAA